jgi:SOS response regulatory protein OraA/RecX
MGESSALHCSFCGKSQGEVLTLICGHGAFICDECVTLSTEVVADRKRAAAGTGRMSAAEIKEAAKRQKETEDALRYANRPTTYLLELLQTKRALLNHERQDSFHIVSVLRDRGVGAATIQQALGISPTDAVEQFLGSGRSIAGEADETVDQTERFPEPIKGLVRRGLARGSVTYQELNAALPPKDFSSEEIEDVLAALSEQGINVVENADDK